MSKRKLSKRQSERIKRKQLDKVLSTLEDPTSTAGQRGQIICHHGKTVDVEYVDDNQQRLTLSCYLRANLETVVTGDFVIWQREDEQGVVVSVEERDPFRCDRCAARYRGHASRHGHPAG